MPRKLHSLQIGRHFLSPQKLFINYRKSAVPEGGWTHENFVSGDGAMLVRDLQAAQNAAKIKGARLLTAPLTKVMKAQIDRVLSVMESKLNRSFPGYRSWGSKVGLSALNLTLSNNQHEDLWAAAIEEAFAQDGHTVLATVRAPLQSVADDVLDKTTTLLTGTSPLAGVRRTLQLDMNEMAQQVTNINETTRRNLSNIIRKAIDDGEHPFAVMEIVRKKLPQIATNRVPTIVRTEMGRAVDRATIISMKAGGQVTHVSVIGCQAVEKGSPTYNGVPTCNIKNVPIEFSGSLRFHPNHTGAIVASGFKKNDGGRPDLPLRQGGENGTWEDRGKPVPAISNEPPPGPPGGAPPPKPAPAPKPPKPAPPVTSTLPKPEPKPKPVPLTPVSVTPPPAPPAAAPKPPAPKPLPAPPISTTPPPVLPPIDLTNLLDEAPIVPVIPRPIAPAPPKPALPSGIHKPTQLVEWKDNVQSHGTEVLNGVPFTEPSNGYWNSVADVELGESPMIVPAGMRKASGLVMVEPDGRVWIVEPKNFYGGYQNTFPKGGVSQGLSIQQSALKEAFEEAGLEAEITGVLGDFQGSTSVSRYYIARRTGGSPWMHLDETQAVKLAPIDVLEPMLNVYRDKEILAALKIKLGMAPVPVPVPVAPAPAAVVRAKPKPKRKPKQEIEPPVSFPKTLAAVTDEFDDIGSAGGTTGARVIRHKVTGEKFIKKTSNSGDDRLASEFIADALYRNAGVRVPQGKLYKTPTGTVKLTKFLDGEIQTLSQYLGTATTAQRSAILEDARKSFHFDAWLGNWDSVGTGKDNMLVVNGKIWRVDNGGALKYRAQGQAKTLFDSDGVPELWTMRNRRNDWNVIGSVNNRDSHEVFGGLKGFTLADNIADSFDAGRFDDALDAFESLIDSGDLPGTANDWRLLRKSLESRAEAMRSLSVRGQRWRTALMDEDFFDDASYEMEVIRLSGIKSQVPKLLKARSTNEWTTMVDENGKLWDHIRGSDSLGSKWLEALCKKEGIDSSSARSLVGRWSSSQAGNSWNQEAQQFKAWIVTRTVDKSKLGPDAFFWKSNRAQNLAGLSNAEYAKRIMADMAKSQGMTVEQADKVLTGWHAYVQTLLENTEMQNVDLAAGTARVFRTESRDVTSIHGLKDSFNPNGKNNVPFPRGPNESTSTVWVYSHLGEEIFEHEVPVCRISAIYGTSRPDSNYDGFFASDSENEFSVNLAGIRAKWVGRKTNYGDLTKLNKPSSNREDWKLTNPYE